MSESRNAGPHEEKYMFAGESAETVASAGLEPWKLLIVDDEEEVHKVTRMVLGDFTFAGRGLEFISAYSGSQTKEVLRQRPGVAVVLLDVVMEDNRSGLEVARFIREDLMDCHMRIILRTGQPGQAPEQKVITDYDINDYKQKAELTAQKLFTSITTAIRSYRDLKIIEENRASLDRLAVSVMHQIRNRTISIGGFAGLLLKKADLDEASRTRLDAIMGESFKLEGIVSSVSDYTNVSVSGLEHISLPVVVSGAVDEVLGKAKETGKGVTLSYEPEELELALDPALFSRALREIFMNAVEFGGAQVNVEVKVETSRGWTLITISDDGPGIADEDLPFVFDPFFTNKPDGVGMGLCIAKKAVLAHHGELFLDSAKGRGTTISIRIPLPPDQGSASE